MVSFREISRVSSPLRSSRRSRCARSCRKCDQASRSTDDDRRDPEYSQPYTLSPTSACSWFCARTTPPRRDFWAYNETNFNLAKLIENMGIFIDISNSIFRVQKWLFSSSKGLFTTRMFLLNCTRSFWWTDLGRRLSVKYPQNEPQNLLQIVAWRHQERVFENLHLLHERHMIVLAVSAELKRIFRRKTRTNPHAIDKLQLQVQLYLSLVPVVAQQWMKCIAVRQPADEAAVLAQRNDRVALNVII